MYVCTGKQENKYLKQEKQWIMENKSTRRTLYRVLRKTGVKRENIQLDASYNEDLKFARLALVKAVQNIFKIGIEDLMGIEIPERM